jgi:ABC-type dipeptide/oligopeptide/nickel transport system ATPase component
MPSAAIQPDSTPQAANSAANAPLLRVQDLAVSFESRTGPRLQAVDGVSLTVHPRQTLAVVGESGCGKSVTAMSALHLVPRPPARFDRGSMIFNSSRGPVDLLSLSESQIRPIRGSKIAMIFQEPMTSLNPVYTIGQQIAEAVMLHQSASSSQARELTVAALTEVGITDAKSRLNAYPHQFSGGMRQRVMIAMALACQPKLLLADEPTTALDVTIQAQILDLLRTIQHTRGMGIMLITHALGVVAENADVVCVMYNGRVVEYATVFDIFDKPLHPYTRGLLASIPKAGARADRLVTIRQVVDDPAQFTQLPGASKGIRPWWPGHKAPADLVPSGLPGGDTCLVEIEQDHWARLWRTEAVAGRQDRFPDLAFRVSEDLTRAR